MKNMLIKVLSVVMALTMIMGAFATIVSAANVDVDVHKHSWENVGHVDATCINPGYDIYECECGETRTQAVEGVLEVCSEDTLVTVEKTAPTCIAPGYLEYTSCTLCGKVSEAEVDPEHDKALGHDYEIMLDGDPQCGEEGEIYGICKVCGDKKVYENIYECPLPGGTASEDFKYCTLAGHKDFLYVITKEPTCTVNGTASYECSEEGCDASIEVTILAPGHNWQVVVGVDADKNPLPYKLTKLATCESNGYRAYECLYCDAEANDESEENKANVEAINAALKAEFTDEKGNFSATAYWAKAAGDLGAYADIDATKIDANVKAAYVGGHILVDLVSPTYNGTTMIDANDADCECVLGCDADGDGKLEFASKVIKFYEEATCSQEGYQWKHCVRDGCEHGKTPSGETTHYIVKEILPKKENHDWLQIEALDKDGNVVKDDAGKTVYVNLYVYTLKYVDATDAERKITVYARDLDEARAKFVAEIRADKNNKADDGTDIIWNGLIAYNAIEWKYLQCTTAINGGLECDDCGLVKPVAEQTVEATGHDYDKDNDGDTLDDAITNLDPNYKDKICHPNAKHTIQYQCVNCTELTKETVYVVDHIYHFTCDDKTCDSNKEHKDDKDNVYYVDCADCTHAGRKYECKVCEHYIEADKPAYKNDQHFDEHKLVITETKVEYYTLDGAFGKVYETCVLPARYVWECTNTECDYTEIHFDPADFTKGDAIWDDKNNNGKLDFDEEGVTADDYAKLAQTGLTEEEFVEIQFEILGKILDKISRGDDDKVSTAVTAHRPYDEKTNKGVKYIAPTCKTDGSAIGFCTWCSENVNETFTKSEAYHTWEAVANWYTELIENPITGKMQKRQATPDCTMPGYTQKYVCSTCGEEKGGEVIEFVQGVHKHVDGCTKTLFKARPATCTIEYSEVYVYPICGRYESVKAGQVNPTNHVYYDYDNDFNVVKITSFLKTIEFVDPTCTTKGTHSFTYCTECNYVVSVDVNPETDTTKTNNYTNDGCSYDDHRVWDAKDKVWKDCASCTTALNDKDNAKNHGLCAGNHCKNHADLLIYNEIVDSNGDKKDESILEKAYNTLYLAKNADGSANDQFARMAAKLANKLPATEEVILDFGKNIKAEDVAAYAKANYRLTEVAGVELKNKGAATATTNNITDAVFAIAELGHNFWFNETTIEINTLSEEAWAVKNPGVAYPGRVLRVLLKETCTTPGHEWEIACSRSCCDYVKAVADDPATKDVDETVVGREYTIYGEEYDGSTILPHGLAQVYRNDKYVPATCLEDGLEDGLFCPLCPDAGDIHAPYEKADAVSGAANGCAICEGTAPRVPALGHDAQRHVKVTNGGEECAKYAVTFNKCTRCDDIYDTDGKLMWVGFDWIPAYKDHTYAKDADGNDVVTTDDENCTEDGRKYKTCTVCGDEVTVEVIPAHGHRNINWNDDRNNDGIVNAYDGDEITFDCKNGAYLINKGTDCDICGKVAAVDADKNVICGIQNANIDHNWVITYVEGGCVTEGGYSYICSECGVTKNDAVHNFVCANCNADKSEHKAGYSCQDYEALVGDKCDCGAIATSDTYAAHGHHDYGTTIKYVPATSEATGLWVWDCRRCGAQIEEVLKYKQNINFDLSVTPYVEGYDSAVLNFVNGGYIEVTLSVNAEKFNFNSYQHTLYFNPEKFEFVSYEFMFEFAEANRNVRVNNDTVKTSGWYNFEAISLVEGDSVEFVKFIFKVAPGVSYFDSTDLDTVVDDTKVSNSKTQNEWVINANDIDAEFVLAAGNLNFVPGDFGAIVDEEYIVKNKLNSTMLDWEYTIEDAVLMQDYILHLQGECGDECTEPEMHEYHNVADINADGVVDMEDFTALIYFVSGPQSVAEYYMMFMTEEVVLNAIAEYDIDDYTKDGFINEKDRKEFVDFCTDEIVNASDWYDAYANNAGSFATVLGEIDEYLN